MLATTALEIDDTMDIDVEIAKYESMSSDEVNAELEARGINPQRAIDAVKALVKRHLDAARPRFSRK